MVAGFPAIRGQTSVSVEIGVYPDDWIGKLRM